MITLLTGHLKARCRLPIEVYRLSSLLQTAGYREPGRRYLDDPEYKGIVELWHPFKNGSLHPSQVTHGSAKKIWLQCRGCPNCGQVHERRSPVYDLTSRQRSREGVCPACASHAPYFCRCRSVAWNPELLAEWHPDNPPPEEIAVGSMTKYKWRCRACQAEFITAPVQRSSYGTGCPHCHKAQKGTKTQMLLKDVRPDLEAEYDQALNKRPFEELSHGTHYKAQWVCRDCRLPWTAAVYHRGIYGTGCPACFFKKRRQPRIHVRLSKFQVASVSGLKKSE